ncbi:MAG: flavodoxin-dependent (E)-4-hydroxy-3-methylbut-2-enyl-diphosphate synthase, partial [Candidatus Dadabacteria bacterium]|nr:flavodoxin-dependent (E)-4-hydroxy-3-methylbut-2-enyl-diphosphate synthase [Candidatus Dadabacteria bacterium]
PLHLGVTEAGTIKMGTIKSSVGIGSLLAQGIGDTIRVSLTGDPVDEIYVGIDILKSLGLRKHGIELISCPGCGRLEIDLMKLVS